MSRILADIRFAFRNLRRAPLFTFVAISSLALGIGANTAVFTLLDQLILRLLPVRDPQQLVMIWSTGPHLGNNNGARAASYPMYQDFQQKAQAFSYVFCRYQTPLSVTFNGRTERVASELVSGNYFQALGVHPALGRVFTPAQDDRVYKGHPSVVLSYAYWASRFAADPNIVGKKIQVNDYPMTIVGVSAAGFEGLDPASAPQLRVPIQMKPLMTPNSDDLGNRRAQWIQIFARMKPGFTVQSAQASLQPLFIQILRDEVQQPQLSGISDYNRKRFFARKVQMETASAGYSYLRNSYSVALIVLMCMVGLVLVIACFNLANLLIARAVARQKEVAVRLSVGASRLQLIGQLMIESLMLAFAGAVAGVVLSVGIVRALLSFLPRGSALFTLSATPDLRVLGFNAGVALLAALLFGLVPALQAMRVDLWNSLKNATGNVSGPGASVMLRKILVVGQVAFSFLLLAGAGLFVKTLVNLKNARTGFENIERLVTFQVDPSLNGYNGQRQRAFYLRALDAINATPGITSAATARVALLNGNEWDSSMGVEGHQAKDGEDIQAYMNEISTGYWKTMGIPLLEGRDFDSRDEKPVAADSRAFNITVAIVNRAFAEHYFPGQIAIGRHLGFGGGPKTKLTMEIIGVVENSVYEGPREGIHRQAFVPLVQDSFPGSQSFYVRTTSSPDAAFAALRQKIQEIDPELPVYHIETVATGLDENLGTERLIALLSAAFGILATVLAAIGLYGVLAFVVMRRTREIGLRMALGASRCEVVWMVMREALLLLAIGLGVGIPTSFLLNRYVSTQLFSVSPNDLGTAAIALAVLCGAAAIAGFLPARRASGIDPMSALRYE